LVDHIENNTILCIAKTKNDEYANSIKVYNFYKSDHNTHVFGFVALTEKPNYIASRWENQTTPHSNNKITKIYFM